MIDFQVFTNIYFIATNTFILLKILFTLNDLGIDLLRLQILHTSIPSKYVDNDGSILDLITRSTGIKTWPKDSIPNKGQETNVMLGLRALSNLFDNKEGRDILGREASKVIRIKSIRKGSFIFYLDNNIFISRFWNYYHHPHGTKVPIKIIVLLG